MRHAKKSTNRDFRMTFKEVPEPEPEPEEEEAQEEDAAQEEVWQQMSNNALVARLHLLFNQALLGTFCWQYLVHATQLHNDQVQR